MECLKHGDLMRRIPYDEKNFSKLIENVRKWKYEREQEKVTKDTEEQQKNTCGLSNELGIATMLLKLNSN